MPRRGNRTLLRAVLNLKIKIFFSLRFVGGPGCVSVCLVVTALVVIVILINTRFTEFRIVCGAVIVRKNTLLFFRNAFFHLVNINRHAAP